MIFALKALLAGLIIAFSSWLAGQNPRMAGFIIALPMASLIAIAFVYFEHNSVEKTVLYANIIKQYLNHYQFFEMDELGQLFHLFQLLQALILLKLLQQYFLLESCKRL